MKAISTGNEYVLYDDGLQIFDQLPAQAYKVVFSKNRGFFLEKYQEPDPREDKIYGDHRPKVDKVMKAFGRINRNLGVILSGAKGIGKTLFAKLLGLDAISRGMPLLVVDRYIPGIAGYLESIQQECMVFFDEFDKTFGDVKRQEGAADPQTEMLPLFDGLIQGKKLFVITCNGTRNLSDYLVNRPGRFHYHFRFDYPGAEEIEVYLKDKLPQTAWGEIQHVIRFSLRIPLNYDCLRAIAFELQDGSTFKEAIESLNIVNVDPVRYTTRFVFNNEKIFDVGWRTIDMFSPEQKYLEIYNANNDYVCQAAFITNRAGFDAKSGLTIVDGADVTLQDVADDLSEETRAAIDSGLARIEFKRVMDPSIHYKV